MAERTFILTFRELILSSDQNIQQPKHCLTLNQMRKQILTKKSSSRINRINHILTLLDLFTCDCVCSYNCKIATRIM